MNKYFMRPSVQKTLAKLICLKDQNDLELLPIKLADLNTRMNQFGLRIRLNLNWRHSGLPFWYAEIRNSRDTEILHKHTCNDINFLLHSLRIWIEKEFLTELDLSPSPSSIPPQELPPD